MCAVLAERKSLDAWSTRLYDFAFGEQVLVGAVPVMCTVIACEASFELNVDIKKSARFLRDLVLHHLRISPWCFSQPELGTNVVIDIFQPDGSQLDRGDVRTLKAILDVAGPVFHGIVDGHAGEADPDSPWQFVG